MFLLYVFLPTVSTANEVSIGVIVDARMTETGRVVEVALEDLKTKPIPTFDYKFEFDNSGTCEIGPNWFKAPYLLSNFYHKKKITAVFGPTCFRDIQSVAKITDLWDILMFNFFIDHPKDAERNNIVQMSTGSTSNIAHNILAFLNGVEWKTIVVISCRDCYGDEEEDVTKHRVEAICSYLQENGIEIVFTRKLLKNSSTDDYVRALTGIEEVARVILPFLGHKLENYNNLQMTMKAKNLTTDLYSTLIPLLEFQSNGITLPWDQDNSLVDIYNNSVVLYNGFGITSNSGAQQIVKELINRMAVPAGHEQASVHLYESIFVHDNIMETSPPSTETKFSAKEVLTKLSNRIVGPFGVPITFGKKSTRISPFAVYHIQNGNLLELNKIHVSEDGRSLIFEVPKFTLNADRPVCGFQGEICDQTWTIIIIFVLLTFALAFVIAVVVFKKMSKRHKVEPSVPWIVPFHTMRLIELGELLTSDDKSNLSLQGSDYANEQLFPQGKTRMAIVSQQCTMVDEYLRKDKLKIKDAAKHLFNIRQLQHDNLNPFLGLSYDKANSFYILWGQCQRGALSDLIFSTKDTWTKNQKIFTKCFVRDILRGLEYIHASNIGYHGELTMMQLYVDHHWILKISGFGISRLLYRWRIENIVYTTDGSPMIPNKELYYHSPEMRRKIKTIMYTNRKEMLQLKDKEGQCADMYSFGVILYEVLHKKRLVDVDDYLRTDPEEEESLLCEQAEALIPSFSPTDTEMGKELHNDLKTLIGNCWNSNPVMRPDCNMARKIIDATMKMHGSLVDQMVRNMEGYTKGLESLVKERTAQLEEAQKKADGLLSELLPRSVAEDLKQGRTINTRTYKSATVMYSDIVGFTSLCSESLPMEVVTFLSRLFSNFDSIIVSNNGYKLETIGDAYCIVSGMPEENKNHVANIANIALKMRRFMTDFEVPHREGLFLHCRWGFNTGTAFSGVVGRRAPKYVVFGQTVTIASKMESLGIPDKIQLTHESAKILRNRHPEFILSRREGGAVKLPGIGYFLTYFLDGIEPVLASNENDAETAVEEQKSKKHRLAASAMTNSRETKSSASSGRSANTVIFRHTKETTM